MAPRSLAVDLGREAVARRHHHRATTCGSCRILAMAPDLSKLRRAADAERALDAIVRCASVLGAGDDRAFVVGQDLAVSATTVGSV